VTNFPVSRARLLALALSIWAAVIIGRLAQIQIAQGPKYRARAQRQQELKIEVPARRGSIFDREGRELAVSVEAFSVYVAPEQLENRRAVVSALAPFVDAKPAAILARLENRRGFVRIARKIDLAAADAIRAKKLPGVHLFPDTNRFYPKGSLAAAVLGFVGTEDSGLAGLEYSYDAAVHGKPGEIVSLTDARRSTYGEAEPPEDRRSEEGSSLVLSLDSGVQFVAERELSASLEELHARSGSVVLMDPWTGDVVAMASAPGFDPNQFSRYPAEIHRNHAVADAYEPGSTFKIVTGAAALDEGLVSTREIIDTGDGTIRIGNVTINEDRHHDYGPLTLAGVFERSSNIGIIRVGLRLGPERLFEGVTRFGVGKPTGVDLPGENPGILRPLQKWSALSNASISMGQEVALTALQLARVAAVVANGGMLVTPRLVTRIVHPDGRSEAAATNPPVRVISAETAHNLSDILVGVVERGTGAKAAIPGFTVAGKTGTAQKAGVGGYQAGRHVPNFVGFAPAEKPRLVGVVVLEEPQGQYYAAEVACPLFSRIMSRALTIMRVAPQQQQLPQSLLASGPVAPAPPLTFPQGVVPAARRQSGNFPGPAPLVAAEPLSEAEEGIPDALGLSAREALALFARRGLSVSLQGKGFVVSQQPSAGVRVRPGVASRLYLSEVAAPSGRSRRGHEESSFTPPSP
jgi:cell division protein FtsI/penicillin-binding protein 2